MSALTLFFKGSDTEFGIFYPRNYLLAVFHDMPAAEHAMKALRKQGFAEDDVIAVPGSDVIELGEELKRKDGVWGLLMQQLSRAFATEEKYTDHDLKLAARGAAFVAVYCPSEKLKSEAWEVLEPIHPIVARHYSTVGIEHLKGEV